MRHWEKYSKKLEIIYGFEHVRVKSAPGAKVRKSASHNHRDKLLHRGGHVVSIEKQNEAR